MPNIRALKDLREKRGLSVADVATFTSIAPGRLADFEQGTREPSRKQMEKLANTYGVALYDLFGNTTPSVSTLPQDFRKRLPSPANISPRGVRTIISAEKISGFAKQLAAELDYHPLDLSREVRLANSTKRRATEARRAFDVWFSAREHELNFSGTREQRFMAAFRLFFEVQGGVLSVNDAPADDFMGFFIQPEAGLPTIFVNRIVSSKKAQLFTLAHEYCHALLGEDGISNPFVARNSIERSCNVFAAEFLAPMDQFAATVESFSRETRSDADRFINAASSKTLLSKHAAAIRLVEGDYISQAQLSHWRRIFISHPRQEKDEERDAAPGGGGQPHAKRIGELGYLPIVLANQALNAGIVDAFDIDQELGLSLPLQERAFGLASRRFEVARS